jgi:hypothetical protein
MNRYILIRRLTGPSILLLLGVVALLHQADLVSWNIFVPLLLILLGLLKLAQRAALAVAGDDPAYQRTPYPYGPGTPVTTASGPAAQPGTAIVPAPPQDLRGDSEGQS